VRLQDILPRERIVPRLAARDKTAALEELVGVLREAGALRDGREAVRALLEREKLGSTGIGDGIAIPHARLRDLPDVTAVFARSPEGVEFGSVDGAPARLLFLLLAPESAAAAHLKALALVSRLCKDPAVRAELLAAGSREELSEIIARADQER